MNAQFAAKKEAARKAQIARFKEHPEELKDPHRCDRERFPENSKPGLDVWIPMTACQDVSGITAERERLKAQAAQSRLRECVDLEDCRLLVRDLQERLALIRSQRAYDKTHAETQSKGFHLTPQARSPCAITPLACKPGTQALEEAFSQVEQYYRKLLRESEERLTKAREQLEKKEDQDAALDRLLDR